eukprot:CAMPEP_0172166856 /NCGR_PEP_ID=MMETSP1050-20130122/9234_1 /TAXON_ID=233186 /ORGANISM="Cryptomonas curvata, Strain CCAP979/52" /LENGTH=460 /DNA_ID=CAMNT_0012837553 /DNA_START=1687 /DNA_END=3065 /DNA_ORIENTATION=-
MWGIELLHMLRLLKLLRLYRIKEAIRTLYRKFPRFRLMITAFELLLALFLSAHWMGCVYFFVGFNKNGWVALQEGIMVPDDSDGAGPDAYALNMDGLYYASVTAIYWAATTMTTIGYGDIVAWTAVEKTVAVAVMVLGCALFAWTTSKITSVITAEPFCAKRFSNRLQETRDFFREHRLPPALEKRIGALHMLMHPEGTMHDESGLLRDLPEGLAAEVQHHLLRDVMAKCPLFAACGAPARRRICRRMRLCYVPEGESLYEEGDTADAVFFVRAGAVDLLEPPGPGPGSGPSGGGGSDLWAGRRVLQTVRAGGCFGENQLIGLSPGDARTRTAVARTMCELCYLPMADARALMDELKELRGPMQRAARLHVGRLEAMLVQGQVPTAKELSCVDWGTLLPRVRSEYEPERGRLVAAASVPRGHLVTRISLHVKQLLSPRGPGASAATAACLPLSGPAVLRV